MIKKLQRFAKKNKLDSIAIRKLFIKFKRECDWPTYKKREITTQHPTIWRWLNNKVDRISSTNCEVLEHLFKN